MFGVINVCDDEVLAISSDSNLMLCIRKYYERIGVTVVISPLTAIDIEAVNENQETVTLRVNV